MSPYIRTVHTPFTYSSSWSSSPSRIVSQPQETRTNSITPSTGLQRPSRVSAFGLNNHRQLYANKGAASRAAGFAAARDAPPAFVRGSGVSEHSTRPRAPLSPSSTYAPSSSSPFGAGGSDDGFIRRRASVVSVRGPSPAPAASPRAAVVESPVVPVGAVSPVPARGVGATPVSPQVHAYVRASTLPDPPSVIRFDPFSDDLAFDGLDGGAGGAEAEAVPKVSLPTSSRPSYALSQTGSISSHNSLSILSPSLSSPSPSPSPPPPSPASASLPSASSPELLYHTPNAPLTAYSTGTLTLSASPTHASTTDTAGLRSDSEPRAGGEPYTIYIPPSSSPAPAAGYSAASYAPPPTVYDRNAKSKLVAGILLHRVHAVGRPPRRRWGAEGAGPKAYVKSGLSSVVSVEA